MKTIGNQTIILNGLFKNEEYSRKVLPFIEPEFFSSPGDQNLFKTINKFIQKYNTLPSKEAIEIDLENSGVPEFIYDATITSLNNADNADSDYNTEWMVNTTEEFCKNQKLYNAMQNGVSIMNDEKKSNGQILSDLQEALGYSFYNDIGHDYIEDAKERWEFYHNKEDKIPFDLEMFNKATAGGVSKKTLNIIIGGTNVGKTAVFCHFAAAAYSAGYNVLYITMEMAEEKIAERIDANLLNVSTDQLSELQQSTFMKRINSLKGRYTGKLIIEEFPTGGAHVGHFKHLLSELRLKKKFEPELVIIDYLNICSSQRLQNSSDSYQYMGEISKELRGFASEENIAIITGTQFNREGFGSTDPDLDNTADSFGIAFNADAVWALLLTDELLEQGQMKVKHLKTRYIDRVKLPSFVVGVDRDHFRLFDVSSDASSDSITNNVIDIPTFDKTPQGLDFTKFQFGDDA